MLRYLRRVFNGLSNKDCFDGGWLDRGLFVQLLLTHYFSTCTRTRCHALFM
jgi:hypothetical protein